MNNININNLNETCKGYLIRAIKIANENEQRFDSQDVKKILNGLRWAFDEMTTEDARKEYDKYRSGKIDF